MIGVEQPVTREKHTVSPTSGVGSRRLLDGFPDSDYALAGAP